MSGFWPEIWFALVCMVWLRFGHPSRCWLDQCCSVSRCLDQFPPRDWACQVGAALVTVNEGHKTSLTAQARPGLSLGKARVQGEDPGLVVLELESLEVWNNLTLADSEV